MPRSANLKRLAEAKEYRNGKTHIDQLLTTQAKDAVFRRVPKRENIQPTPIHDFGDPKYRNMLVNVVAELNATLEPTYDEKTGLSGDNAVAGNFDRVLTDMGHGMTPKGHQPDQNAELRREMGLAVEPDEAMKQRAIAYYRLLYKRRVNVESLRITDGPSSGPKFMVTDRADKLKLIEPWFNAERYIMEPLAKGSTEHLYKLAREGYVFSGVSGTRTQQELKEKKRRTYGPFECYYKEKDDSYPEYADKTSPADERFSAGRLRLFDGIAMHPNVHLAKYVKPHDEYFNRRYPFTFKHRGPDVRAAKVNRVKRAVEAKGGVFKLICFDMTQFDFTFSEELHALEEYVTAECYDKPVAAFRKVARSSPLLRVADEYERDKYDIKCFISKSFDQVFDAAGPLKSGSADTSTKGKGGCGAHVNEVLHRLAPETMRQAPEAWLEHDLTYVNDIVYAIIDGDDHVIFGRADLVDKYTTICAKEELWFRASPNGDSVAAGQLYIERNGVVEVVPNISSFFEKTFACERDWRSPLRISGFSAGLHDKMEYYRSAPSFGQALEILDRHHSDAYGFSFSEYVRSLPEVATPIAALLKERPELIYYRIDPADVPLEVFEGMFVSKPYTKEDLAYPFTGEYIEYDELVEYERSMMRTLDLDLKRINKFISNDDIFLALNGVKND